MKTEMMIRDEKNAFKLDGKYRLVRVEERGFLDPLYENDPILKIELLDEYSPDAKEDDWLDVTNKVDKCMYDQILAKLANEFEDTDPEVTQPMRGMRSYFNGEEVL